MKSANLNFLEPPGPLQACHGTAALLTRLYAPLLGVGNMQLTQCIPTADDTEILYGINRKYFQRGAKNLM